MLYKLNDVRLSDVKNLQTLVENRTIYNLERCELNVFETYEQSYKVPLTFDDFVITSMLRGKKTMHFHDQKGFDYVPGQTVIVPPKVTMEIDFPEASAFNPTQCIALEIDHEQIKKTLNYLNEFFPKEDLRSKWLLTYDDYHFHNSAEISSLMNKVISICADSSTEKNVLADLTLKELLIRIMQHQNLESLKKDSTNQNPLAYVVGYIKENLHERITIEHLSEKAYMSKSTFYRLFKRELGMTPNDYILSEKMNKAKTLLANPENKVASIGYELGFEDSNYFIRAFKKIVGITPGAYQINSRK